MSSNGLSARAEISEPEPLHAEQLGIVRPRRRRHRLGSPRSVVEYRDDVEALKGILVSARGMASTGQTGAMSGIGGGGTGAPAPPALTPGPGPPMQIPLAAVADVRVVEGPAMIKSENGLLRDSSPRRRPG